MIEEKIEIEEAVLYAEGIFGAKERKGLVKLSYGITFEILITPAEAREYARCILECAEAAETDEFIVNWLEKRIGITGDQEKLAVLFDFRSVRQSMRDGEIVEPRK